MPIIRSWASAGHRPPRSATNLRRTRSQTGSESMSTPSMSNTTALITLTPRTPPCLSHRVCLTGNYRLRTLAEDQGELTGLRHQPADGVPDLRVFLEVAVFQVPGQRAEGEPAGGGPDPQVHGELH